MVGGDLIEIVIRSHPPCQSGGTAPSDQPYSQTHMAKERELKAGDAVEWETSQGKTEGKVVKRVTTPMEIKTHQVAASEENPEYVVQSKKSGKQAAHKAAALRKISK
jgi:hypothetical protein